MVCIKRDNKMNIEAMERAEGRKNIPILNKRKSFENNLNDIWLNNVFLKIYQIDLQIYGFVI
jgi:hypothetical protein